MRNGMLLSPSIIESEGFAHNLFVRRVANQLMGLSSLVAAPFELVIAIVFLYQ